MAKQQKLVVVEKNRTVKVDGRDLPMPPCKMVGVHVKNADEKYRVGVGGVVEKRR